ncbi:hypothetical protein [Streptomyces sp. NPDC054987]
MMVIRGLHPDRSARLEALVDECRPLLGMDDGMAAVQRLLSEHRVEVLDAVMITRELLGAGPEALGEAKTIVLTSPGRGRELTVHEQFVGEAERGLSRLPKSTDHRP